MTVFKLALRGIRASIGRLILTTIAILAGVGFVAGAFILADSLESTFGGIFEEASADIDARVSVAEFEFGDDERSIPDTLVDELEALPEVGRVRPEITIEEVFTPFVALDENGDEVKPQGPPIITFSWDGSEGGGLSLGEGTPPQGVDQTAIDRDYADLLGAQVGDVFTFNTPDGQRDFEIASIVDFEITGGAFFVLFDFESAQTLYDKEGLVDGIALSRASGVTTEDMIAAVEAVIPAEAAVQNQAEVIEEQSAQFEQIIGIFRTLLLVFAGIALFVSLFIIYNTFAILVTQRLQQIGMLRAIGASRRQVRLWVLIEATLVGVVGSALGLLAGLGVAFGIKSLFQAGGGFPDTDTVVLPRTVLVALAVGLIATLVSALVPALLASRTPPMAAIRPQRRQVTIASFRVLAGAAMLAVGAILMGLGLAGKTGAVTILGVELSTGWVIGIEFGLGAALLFIGMFLFSVLFAGPVVDVIGQPVVLGLAMFGLGAALIVAMFLVGDGAPASPVVTEVVNGVEQQSFSFGNLFGWVGFIIKLLVAVVSALIGLAVLLAKFTGLRLGIGSAAGSIEGHLARRNAARSPTRTAATATALTIGIALVSTVSVVGESLKASFSSTLDRSIRAELFIYDEETQSAFSGQLAAELESVDGLDAISRFRANEIRIGEDVESMAAYDADTGDRIIDFGLQDGSTDPLVNDNGILVFQEVAAERGLSVGDVLTVEFPDLETEQMTVAGIFEDNSVLNSPWVIDMSVYERHIEADEDFFVGASIPDGADLEATKAEVLAITDTFSSVTAQDNQEFRESQEGQVDSLISLINYLLGFALFVAFVGVINTIVLSVVERTREIGLLRAVGTTRKQIRGVVRWEAVIVCIFGALLGILLGVLFGWAAVSAIPDDIISDIAIPYESVIFTILIAALAGVAAAVIPAYLAAKRNVLESIATPT
jgi:ABC-type antimicrobial peptide transport system permease subunit